MIAGSVDDRTEEERGLKVRRGCSPTNLPLNHSLQPLHENRFVIPKSRYDSVDLYISEDPLNHPSYNDTQAPYDSAIYNRLRDSGECFTSSRYELSQKGLRRHRRLAFETRCTPFYSRPPGYFL